MKYQAANPNPNLLARHTIYIAKTGGGKSQALKQNPDIPRKGARVVGWDHAGDHPGLHFYSRASFAKALRHAIAKGGGFRIFYAGKKSVKEFEWFCEVVWSILDGNHLTFCIVEELARVSPSAAKASTNAAELLNEGRKYGLVFHGTSQKPQEVAKTYFDQCDIKYIGMQRSKAMLKRMAEQIDLEPADIKALKPLQFFRDDGIEKPHLVTFKYKDTRARVIWRD